MMTILVQERIGNQLNLDAVKANTRQSGYGRNIGVGRKVRRGFSCRAVKEHIRLRQRVQIDEIFSIRPLPGGRRLDDSMRHGFDGKS